MTTYYISPDGSNANNGLGPDASAATNKPWLTIAKALNTGSTVLPGDTVYLAPGSFLSEPALAPIAAISSTGSPTAFRGDPLNVQGFKTAGGVLRSPSVVTISRRTSLQLDSNPASGNLMNLGSFNPAGLQFYHLFFDGGTDIAVVMQGAGTLTDILFEDCRIIGGGNAVDANTAVAPTAGRNWTFRRCIILAGSTIAFDMRPGVAAATANADLNINFEHCLIFGKVATNIGTTAGNKAGGIHLKGCTMFNAGAAGIFQTVSGGGSTVVPSTYEGCLFIGMVQIANTPDAGTLVDSGYNRGVSVQSANTNTTEAATTARNVPAFLVLPDLLKWGLALPTDKLFGWTADAQAPQKFSGWINTQSDFFGRTARPWGAGPSVGAIEYADVSQDTSGAIAGGGTNSLKLTGAGEYPMFVPVNGGESTTITVVTESSGYGGTNYPQLIMEANPSAGITQQTATAVSASEQTLTIGPFTPTVDGVVELRAVSRSSSPASTTEFDILALVEA